MHGQMYVGYVGRDFSSTNTADFSSPHLVYALVTLPLSFPAENLHLIGIKTPVPPLPPPGHFYSYTETTLKMMKETGEEELAKPKEWIWGVAPPTEEAMKLEEEYVQKLLAEGGKMHPEIAGEDKST